MESYVKELYINFISLQYEHGSNKISSAYEEFKQLLIARAELSLRLTQALLSF